MGISISHFPICWFESSWEEMCISSPVCWQTMDSSGWSINTLFCKGNFCGYSTLMSTSQLFLVLITNLPKGCASYCHLLKCVDATEVLKCLCMSFCWLFLWQLHPRVGTGSAFPNKTVRFLPLRAFSSVQNCLWIVLDKYIMWKFPLVDRLFRNSAEILCLTLECPAYETWGIPCGESWASFTNQHVRLRWGFYLFWKLQLKR